MEDFDIPEIPIHSPENTSNTSNRHYDENNLQPEFSFNKNYLNNLAHDVKSNNLLKPQGMENKLIDSNTEIGKFESEVEKTIGSKTIPTILEKDNQNSEEKEKDEEQENSKFPHQFLCCFCKLPSIDCIQLGCCSKISCLGCLVYSYKTTSNQITSNPLNIEISKLRDELITKICIKCGKEMGYLVRNKKINELIEWYSRFHEELKVRLSDAKKEKERQDKQYEAALFGSIKKNEVKPNMNLNLNYGLNLHGQGHGQVHQQIQGQQNMNHQYYNYSNYTAGGVGGVYMNPPMNSNSNYNPLSPKSQSSQHRIEEENRMHQININQNISGNGFIMNPPNFPPHMNSNLVSNPQFVQKNMRNHLNSNSNQTQFPNYSNNLNMNNGGVNRQMYLMHHNHNHNQANPNLNSNLNQQFNNNVNISSNNKKQPYIHLKKNMNSSINSINASPHGTPKTNKSDLEIKNNHLKDVKDSKNINSNRNYSKDEEKREKEKEKEREREKNRREKDKYRSRSRSQERSKREREKEREKYKSSKRSKSRDKEKDRDRSKDRKKRSKEREKERDRDKDKYKNDKYKDKDRYYDKGRSRKNY